MTTEERLARATRVIAIVCTLLMLLVIFFPPWLVGRANWNGLVHGFLFAPPRYGSLYMSMFLLEILGILCAGVLAWLIVKLVASRKGDNP